MPEIYLVGGAVRDSLLGLQSKDLDYTYVADNTESIKSAYSEMKEYMLSEGFNIFLETPDCLTIRAKFPDHSDHRGLTGDFVLARKELFDSTHLSYPIVVPGTLEDDLSRRDFTINAIAQCTKSGKLIDLFNGQQHLKDKVLITPLEPINTYMDDPLRILRTLRFSITLGFKVHSNLRNTIRFSCDKLVKRTKQTVSADRIRTELSKAFKANSYLTISKLFDYPIPLVQAWFPEGLWLQPTFKNNNPKEEYKVSLNYFTASGECYASSWLPILPSEYQYGKTANSHVNMNSIKQRVIELAKQDNLPGIDEGYLKENSYITINVEDIGHPVLITSDCLPVKFATLQLTYSYK
jgi:tRNA nucleotidyltransferase/poly(A) polymerase